MNILISNRKWRLVSHWTIRKLVQFIGIFGILWIGYGDVLASVKTRIERRREGTENWGHAELIERDQRIRGAARASVRGIVELLGLLEELEGIVADSKLEKWLIEVIQTPRLHPFVSDYARFLLGGFWEVRGRLSEARQIYDDLGYLREWSIVGPFENSSRRSRHFAYGPEKIEFAIGQSFSSRVVHAKVSWNDYDANHRMTGAWVSLDEAILPNSSAIAYATNWIWTSDEDEVRAILHIGTGGPYKVWCNGKRIAEGSHYRSPHPLQDGWEVILKPGWNRILIKIAADDGQLGFYARLSDVSGKRLRTLKYQSQLPKSGVSSVKSESNRSGSDQTGSSEIVPAGVRHLLERAGAGERSRLADKQALLEFYQHVRPVDLRKNNEILQLASEVDEQLKLPWTAKIRSDLTIGLFSNDRQQNLRHILRRTKAVEQSKAIKKIRIEASVELFNEYLLQGQEWKAMRSLLQMQKLYPDHPKIRLMLATSNFESGLPNYGLGQLETLAMEFPFSVEIQRAVAEKLIAIGKVKAGGARLSRIVRRLPFDRSLSSSLLDYWIEAGQADRALKLAEFWRSRFPKMPTVYRWLSRVHAAQSNRFRQIEAMQKVVELLPFDAYSHRHLGELLALSKSREASIAAFEQSLHLRPEQPILQNLLRRYRQGMRDDFVDQNSASLEIEWRKLQSKTLQGRKEHAIFLVHRIASRHSKYQWIEQFEQRIIHILDNKGAQEQSLQSFIHDPSQGLIELRRARIRRRNGSIHNIEKMRVYSVVEAEDKAYYDRQQLDVLFPRLRVGDTLEVVFHRKHLAVSQRSRPPIIKGALRSELHNIESSIPKLEFSYILETSEPTEMRFNLPVQQKKLKSKGGYRYQFVRSNVESKLRTTSNLAAKKLLAHLHVSPALSWDEIGNDYWDLLQGQLMADSNIRNAIQDQLQRENVRDDASELEKIDALFRLVSQNIRYVGLEFGIHGFQPYPTNQVFLRKFGDCKDKASLLKVMLEEVGVVSHLSLVRTRDVGRVGKSPASLVVFNHAVLYVPKYNLFLDATAKYEGLEKLSAIIQGAEALIVRDGQGTKWTMIPPKNFVRHATRQKQAEF